ncbi:hypothetical protein FY036_15200 [Mesorhizobium microcysteis]|jgi:hypothetical protein|uniref:DUF6894 domain-containing protein n=1 Tax=Neoaquamicrobium microcysteis TaxID=2682781 RepID=A0A5D4GYL4_9HYPH|nr:hypothetical protein [Mesorhizobium microcysteis]TYR31610.1 hypothetical protein FY036_15200 [Mesorhizobium microcysteis]
MPHFYFDTWAGDHLTVDDAGHEFGSVEEAKQLATITLLDMARENAAGFDGMELAIDVRQEEEPILKTSLLLKVSTAGS